MNDHTVRDRSNYGDRHIGKEYRLTEIILLKREAEEFRDFLNQLLLNKGWVE